MRKSIVMMTGERVFIYKSGGKVCFLRQLTVEIDLVVEYLITAQYYSRK